MAGRNSAHEGHVREATICVDQVASGGGSVVICVDSVDHNRLASLGMTTESADNPDFAAIFAFVVVVVLSQQGIHSFVRSIVYR